MSSRPIIHTAPTAYIGAPKHVMAFLDKKYCPGPKRPRTSEQDDRIQGFIQWHEHDDASWKPCTLTNVKLVQKYIRTATIVYNECVLKPCEEDILNRKNVLLVDREGERPYITWASEDFHWRINYADRNKTNLPRPRNDAPVSNVWELQPPENSPDVMNRAAGAQHRCLYILDVTQLVPIHCSQLAHDKPLEMGRWFWKKNALVGTHEDTVIDAHGFRGLIRASSVEHTI